MLVCLYLCLRVCACVRACVRVFECVRLCVFVRACARVCQCLCVYVVCRIEKKGGTRAGLREIGRGKGRRVRWPPTDDGGHGARATDLEVVARYRAHY